MAEDQRLIDVNEAIFQIKARERVAIPDTDGRIRISTKAFKQFLMNQIVIDPVKHGHWVQRFTGDENIVFCSNCSEQANEMLDYKLLYDFCPNCGAKMDEEVE